MASDNTLKGKTVIVTGANTGIGKVTARELARKGARVILGCRNAERGEEARREIVEDTKNEDVVVQILDLASLKSVKQFADQFNQIESRLDILVNNAGVFTKERRETSDGFEMEFGTNHLGHFYLTYLLLDKIKASAPSRIVIVTSAGHRFYPIDLTDLQSSRSYHWLTAEERSKTANILHSTQLAKLLTGTGVTTYSVNPGSVRTEICREYKGSCLGFLFTCCCGCITRTPDQGAATTLYCCLEPSIAQQSGRYYSNSREATAAAHAVNPATAEELWRLSAELCKVPDLL